MGSLGPRAVVGLFRLVAVVTAVGYAQQRLCLYRQPGRNPLYQPAGVASSIVGGIV